MVHTFANIWKGPNCFLRFIHLFENDGCIFIGTNIMFHHNYFVFFYFTSNTNFHFLHINMSKHKKNEKLKSSIFLYYLIQRIVFPFCSRHYASMILVYYKWKSLSTSGFSREATNSRYWSIVIMGGPIVSITMEHVLHKNCIQVWLYQN